MEFENPETQLFFEKMDDMHDELKETTKAVNNVNLAFTKQKGDCSARFVAAEKDIESLQRNGKRMRKVKRQDKKDSVTVRIAVWTALIGGSATMLASAIYGIIVLLGG